MNYLLKVFLVVFTVVNLSGCLTTSLTKEIDSAKTYRTEKISDRLTHVYLPTKDDKNKPVQIKGDKKSYMFIDYGDDINAIFNALGDDVDDVIIKQDGGMETFTLNSVNVFNGKFDFSYVNKGVNPEQDKKFSDIGFKCTGTESVKCILDGQSVGGRIDSAPVIIGNQKIIKLQHPVPLTLDVSIESTSASTYALALLYPFAIVGDIISSPFQLIILPILSTSVISSGK